jgi:hypothetical protein
MRDRVTAPLCLALPAQGSSPALARRFLTAALVEWDRLGRLDDALIAVTELVENALRHTDGGCLVVLHRAPREVVVAVADTSPRPPEPRPLADPVAAGGRGLLIVGQLAAYWDSAPTRDGGKVVWVGIADTAPP